MMINTDAVKAVQTLDMESEVLITSPGKNVPYKMKVTELVAAVETNKKKVYKALLTQTGTDAPTAIVLENTLGDIVWTRSSQGYYDATLTGAFNSEKVFILMSPSADYTTGPTGAIASIHPNFIRIASYNSLIDDSADTIFQNSPILIEVYP